MAEKNSLTATRFAYILVVSIVGLLSCGRSQTDYNADIDKAKKNHSGSA